MIELLNKAAKDWTEIEIVVETIKLWSFLAENGERTKEQYFESEYVPILSDCFLCEYYFRIAKKAEEKYNQLTGKKVCQFFNCCLKGTVYADSIIVVLLLMSGIIQIAGI